MALMDRKEKVKSAAKTALGLMLAVAALIGLIAFVLAMPTYIMWNEPPEWRPAWAGQTEADADPFSWASPECITQEVGNPHYRNNEQDLRLCELEHTLGEIQQQLEELKPASLE